MRQRATPSIIMTLALLPLSGCWPNSPRPLMPDVDTSAEPLPAVDPPIAVAQAPLPVEHSPYHSGPISRSAPEPAAKPAVPEPEPPPPPRPLPPVRPVVHDLEPITTQPASEVEIRKPARDYPVVEALRCLLEKRPADAVVPLDRLDKPTQDLLLRFLPVIARLSEGSLEKSDPEELALTTGQLEEVIRTLQPRSTLVVDKMCFCRRIDKFGQYDPLPPDYRFKPGEMVLVYVELQNFSCKQVDGFYETRLASSVEIQDAQNHTVWRQDLNDRDRPDRSRSLRNDYCNGYRFCIPDNIPPGVYRLVLRVSDVHLPERKPAERSLVLRVTTRPLAETKANR